MDYDSKFENMKKIIKDAGINEENMSREDIESICQVITQSRMEVESGNESLEDLPALIDEDTTSDTSKSPSLLQGNSTFITKTWSQKKPKPLLESRESDEDDSVDSLSLPSAESLIDATKSRFGFSDMPESSENSLRFVPRESKFIPIQSTTTFSKASCSKKNRMLYSYHTKVRSFKTQLAKSSFYKASSETSTNTHEVVPSVSDISDNQDTYTSRSGRQTKRKVYYDQDEDSFDGTAFKKTKSFDEQEWPCKIKTPSRKIEKASEDKDMGDSEKNSATNEDKKCTSKNSENVKSSTRTKKPTNAEIMRRSALFSESPPQLTRNDVIFNSLVEENNKKVIEEKIMDSFEKTLDRLDDGLETTDEVINVDEEPVRQRVVPPLPAITGRKPINSRRKRREPLDIQISPTNNASISTMSPIPSNDSVPIPNKKKIGPNRTAQSSPAINRNQPSVLNKVECPMCGISFTEGREIEEHAWSCEIIETRSQTQKRITCHICDMVVPLTTEYEVHVNECLRRKREEENKK